MLCEDHHTVRIGGLPQEVALDPLLNIDRDSAGYFQHILSFSHTAVNGGAHLLGTAIVSRIMMLLCFLWHDPDGARLLCWHWHCLKRTCPMIMVVC